MKDKKESPRAFKVKKFSKDAEKAHITDKTLHETIKEVIAGQAVDLGGGVYKKRLNKNEHRCLILAKGGKLWIVQYLFAKKDLDNIATDELLALKKLAKAYEAMSSSQLAKLIEAKRITGDRLWQIINLRVTYLLLYMHQPRHWLRLVQLIKPP